MVNLTVNVNATHEHDGIRGDNDMLLVVEVLDSGGNPVTGLEKSNFECRQLGMGGAGSINIRRLMELGTSTPSLSGMYYLIPIWDTFFESQLAFTVIVTRDSDTNPGSQDFGRGTASLVTQGTQN